MARTESLRLRVAARESDLQVPFSKFADFERHRHEQAKNIGEIYTKAAEAVTKTNRIRASTPIRPTP
jgi:hypothetical protein